jgi:molybdate transport system substrate-binding protein
VVGFHSELVCSRRIQFSQIMNRSDQSKRLLFAITPIFALPAALPAQVSVIISGGFFAADRELLPQFEKSTGIRLTTERGASQGDGPTTLGAQLRRGVPADVVILSREGLPIY